jgi:(p)ppGpp synthase/HD superfamily hydrolase
MYEIINAINYMTKAHKDQYRKSNGLPKSSHLFSVATILMQYGYDKDIIITGLLHDVVEDCKEYTLDDIEKEFGKKISDYVSYVTEISKEYSWKERKDHAIETLKRAPFESKVVYAADKIHNLISLKEDYKIQGEKLWDSFNADKKSIIWYYNEICSSIKQGYDNIPIFDEMIRVKEDFFGEYNG